MSEQRFTLDRRAVSSNYAVGKVYDNEKKSSLYIQEVVDKLNEQQDQISYWKHKVNGLLWILSQFDEEKVKELLKELEDE